MYKRDFGLVAWESISDVYHQLFHDKNSIMKKLCHKRACRNCSMYTCTITVYTWLRIFRKKDQVIDNLHNGIHHSLAKKSVLICLSFSHHL